jgi:hypothetical protein
MAYEPLGKPRFVVDESGQVELIRIKARRQVFALMFLPIWLAGWTVGGVFAITAVVRQFNLFLVLWLCGWALGWVYASATIAWMLFGSETLRVVDRDLELGFSIGPWAGRKVYQGSQVRDLKSSPQIDPYGAFRFNTPFMPRTQGGAVQFTYGGRTIRAGAGLDEAEGQLIVARLSRRLPATAVAVGGGV